MLTTIKLCNLRDCSSGKFPTHELVNTCEVYYNAEDKHWYNERTGQSIRNIYNADGTLAVAAEDWLNEQLNIASKAWKRGMKVHEQARVMKPRNIEKPEASIPEETQENLDKAAAHNIKMYNEKALQIHQEIRSVRTEIHGYVRIGKKYGFTPELQSRINQLRSKVSELRDTLKDFAEESKHTKSFIDADNAWVNRWLPRVANITQKYYVYEKGKDRYEIDSNGLMKNGMYEFLPVLDCDFAASKQEAQKLFNIPVDKWEEFETVVERVGRPIRKLGKKNSIGARIRATADHCKTVAQARNLLKALATTDFPLDSLEAIFKERSHQQEKSNKST